MEANRMQLHALTFLPYYDIICVSGSSRTVTDWYTNLLSKTWVPTVDKNELSFGYSTLRAEHMWQRKWTCRTYIAAAPNQTLTPLFIHSNTGQDHTMHIFLYVILSIVGVGVSEIKLLKYGMTSVFDRVLISNTTICNVCQGWPVSTAYFTLKLGTRMFTWIVKFSSCHMKKEALHCFRVARSNRRKNSILVHLQVQWLMK